ncbi:SUPPRESSOR OF GAMMA RESPONSE 1 isoform X2 [Tripterygium wilfordii]|uniref:SUPPRESSOR OF GAMMA RESPONSE 1 isoform X2 n=1 Tax=Tripterygium wilfordii TaxID=458696 RepID=UPI0018F81573|nr:SUPPRESSOR OF GAMMA RESPONSE 1 isoform X2 [Tripterygium wilfordii]
MAGSWLVDGNRFATKIKSASGKCDHEGVNWKSNPSRACPNCQHVIDNSDVTQEWPGLPRGVKFDPSDQEIIWHLLAKVEVENLKPHPFIDEFIPTVLSDDGICYAHPQNLPGVKQDGSASHLFHRAVKAYNSGTRKRRKIHGDDFGDVRWHKTGRTKPVFLDGVQKGCKKIMVLYASTVKGGKAEKTNWVMHQYHLGTEEDEKEGEFIVSKIFYQQQQAKQNDKAELDLPQISDSVIAKVDPVTPKSVTPDPPHTERRSLEFDKGQKSTTIFLDTNAQHLEIVEIEDEVLPGSDQPNYVNQLETDDHDNQMLHESKAECPGSRESDNANHPEDLEIVEIEDEVLPGSDQPNYVNQLETDDCDNQMPDESKAEFPGSQGNENGYHPEEDSKWWDSESQHLLNSQQLVEGLSLCDELLQSQSPSRGDRDGKCRESDGKPCLSDYVKLGAEELKKDMEVCQNLVLDPANIELDTPPEFRLSQLDFGSQESFLAWGGDKVID